MTVWMMLCSSLRDGLPSHMPELLEHPEWIAYLLDEDAKLRDAERVGIRGGVQTLDGLPAASRDGFTATRNMTTVITPPVSSFS